MIRMPVTLAAFLLTLAAWARGPISIEVEVDPSGPVISPLLFGHNLEHTRQAVWRGLSAQLVANRKFAGPVTADFNGPQTITRGPVGPDGVAAHWKGIGQDGVSFQLDPARPFCGVPSQRITVKEGGQGGIEQRGIVLESDKVYDLHVWFQSDRELTVLTVIADDLKVERGSQRPIFDQTTCHPGEWREWSWTFQKPGDPPAERLRFEFDGPGTLWVGAVSILPRDHFHGMRRDVVDLMKEISVPILRWPGGNFTRDYVWKDGLLPVDRRPPIAIHWHETQPFADNVDDHEIGIDEYMELCRYLGAEPNITSSIDPKTAPPQEAADWVEYCNGPADRGWGKVRADRGHAEPYRVKYWSIGNEVWGGWMGLAHSDAKTYAGQIAQYAAAMKKVDPSIVLIASGLPGDWDKELLPLVAGKIDLISEHDYAGEGQVHVASPTPAEFVRMMKLPGTNLLGMLRGARRQADAASKDKPIGISFDEWNVWHNWFVRPMENEWHVGPIDALYAATVLNALCRDHQSLGVKMANYFQPVNEGAIAVTPLSAHLTPVGQVFALYKAHQGNRLLATKTQGDTGIIDVCASLASDGHEIVLTLVNHDPSQAQRIEIGVGRAKTIGEGNARVLSASELKPDIPMADRTEQLHVENGRLSLTLPCAGVALARLKTN